MLLRLSKLCEGLGNYKEELNISVAAILANMQRPEAPHLINQYVID
jgi:hypothetical protein